MLSLFLCFLKIGLFTFGGGYAMIAQIKESVVQRKGWITEDELIEVIAIAESTPGPIAINLATFVGYKRKGFWGSVAATLGVTVPSVCIIFLISLFLDAFMANRYVAYAFRGIQCAVAFLILKAGFDMLSKVPRKPLPLITFVAVLSAMIVFDLFAINFSSIFFILIGGLIGIVVYGLLSNRKGGPQ